MAEVITHHYPTFQLDTKTGKFRRHPGQIVGRVLPDGSIENTNCRTDPSKIRGGVAVTTHKKMRRVDKDTLENIATGERFKRTRKGTGFFSRESRSYVLNPYQEDEGRTGRASKNCPLFRKKREWGDERAKNNRARR